LTQKLRSSGSSKDDLEDFEALIPDFAFALKNQWRSIHIPEELDTTLYCRFMPGTGNLWCLTKLQEAFINGSTVCPLPEK
jgi:hypothetical protein